MRALLFIAVAGAALTACAPVTQLPTSSSQWERRQNDIAYREQERVRLCALIDKDSDRWKRDCDRPGAAD